MDWLTTLRALWAKLTGPKKAEVVVEKLPALAPGDMLALYMPKGWTMPLEDRERWLDGVQRAVGADVTLIVLPEGVTLGVIQREKVVVNNTVGGEAGPEIVAAAVRRSTGEGI